jgi:hypothetical protein
MDDKFVECGSHGKSKPAFVGRHLIEAENIGWNEPAEYSIDEYFEFAGGINGWCDKCEAAAVKSGGWNDESEAFAGITLICENCALKFKEAKIK